MSMFLNPYLSLHCLSDVLMPGSTREVSKQFFRCVLIKLAPNGIFSELFRSTLKGKSMSFQKLTTLAKAKRKLLHDRIDYLFSRGSWFSMCVHWSISNERHEVSTRFLTQLQYRSIWRIQAITVMKCPPNCTALQENKTSNLTLTWEITQTMRLTLTLTLQRYNLGLELFGALRGVCQISSNYLQSWK